MIHILTLVLMVSTTSQNRAMTSLTAEYTTSAACNSALQTHLNRINSVTYGVSSPERLVGVILANCTKKK